MIGFIGVGHLAVSLLKGMSASDYPASDVLLTSRGYGREMASSHGFGLSELSEDIVERCDLVVLAVRPADVETATTGLPWREGQTVLSACAGVSIERLQACIAPAKPVRIMPITSAELGASPTIVYPEAVEAERFLSALGEPVLVASEDQFETATASAAMYGWAQALIGSAVDWSVENGLESEQARQLIARSFVAAGRMVAEQSQPIDTLIESLCTPGGITRLGLGHLRDADVLKNWQTAFDKVQDKLKGS